MKAIGNILTALGVWHRRINGTESVLNAVREQNELIRHLLKETELALMKVTQCLEVMRKERELTEAATSGKETLLKAGTKGQW